jgi:hypothetical protein
VSAAAVALALGAAVLHAGWNLAVKDGPDRLLALWAIIVVASVPCVAVLVVLGPPPASIAPLVVTSALLHVVYDGAMAAVYGRSDLGVAYPSCGVARSGCPRWAASCSSATPCRCRSLAGSR